MILNLSRKNPALPDSYFWTWDHSTNWVLDDPGIQNFGSYNRYLKKTETFIKDYKLLIDFTHGIGIKGVVLWGFLRDSHGGVEASKEISYYANERNVSLMPGIGVTWYGGPYFEGDHKYNINTFLKENPSAGSKTMGRHYLGICPSNPLFKEWIEEGLEWLFKSFAIGGINLENGDFFLCGCEKCNGHKKNWPEEDPEFYRLQALGYDSVFEYLGKIKGMNKELLLTWATYTGFLPGKEENNMTMTPYMGCKRPYLFDSMNNIHNPQWTLTRMVRQDPLPLDCYLDDGMPEEVFNNPYWPKELIPPSSDGTGFIHQGSQWRNKSRYNQIVSTIKESALRAYLSGLKGISIHGEVTSIHIPAAMNYLAFSHFTHWPLDTMRDFGRKTLGEVFESEREGEEFIEIFAAWDSNNVTKNQLRAVIDKRKELIEYVTIGNDTKINKYIVRFKFWCWLYKMVTEEKELHTANSF